MPCFDAVLPTHLVDLRIHFDLLEDDDFWLSLNLEFLM